MRAPVTPFHPSCASGIVASDETNDERILAHSPYGHPRRESGTGTQVRGPRRQRGNHEARSLGRDRRQWTRIAHHARSIPGTDSGGLELSVGLPQTPDAVRYRRHFPSQGKMTLPLEEET